MADRLDLILHDLLLLQEQQAELDSETAVLLVRRIEKKKTKGILGATMVTGRKETSVWPLQQTDGRTYKRRPAVLIQVGAVVVGTW